jgi:hypothetical protein
MTASASTQVFRAARDLLLAHRTDYGAARREFAWPDLDEFNWALDWFDVIAAEHPDRPGLRIVSDDGSDVSLSYGSLAGRSAQVANWLRGLGVRRGDRVLLMLGNVVPLWEVILAAMKLGAVIIPASTLLQPADLADRIARGQVRHVVADAVLRCRFALRVGELPGDDVLRAADRVADAAPGRPGRGGRFLFAGMRRGRRAAESGGDRAGPQGLGDHGAGRLRPDRDHRAGRQHPRAAGPAGFDGAPAAGILGRAGRPGQR